MTVKKAEANNIVNVSKVVIFGLFRLILFILLLILVSLFQDSNLTFSRKWEGYQKTGTKSSGNKLILKS
jgi:hypothetical protein